MAAVWLFFDCYLAWMHCHYVFCSERCFTRVALFWRLAKKREKRFTR